MHTINTVPNEFLYDIFLFMDGLKINKNKEVCRRWLNIVESEYGYATLPLQKLDYEFYFEIEPFGIFRKHKKNVKFIDPNDFNRFRRCFLMKFCIDEIAPKILLVSFESNDFFEF